VGLSAVPGVLLVIFSNLLRQTLLRLYLHLIETQLTHDEHS
jgi:hypothetical protein